MSEEEEPTREALRRARADAEAQVSALSDDLRGIIEASRSSNADDEHDPEGATIAFERAQVHRPPSRRPGSASTDWATPSPRHAADAYGICEACGRPIPPERLAVRPAARLCVTCAARR